MNPYSSCVIKSYKHDGHLHRMWVENWMVPKQLLHADHAARSITVTINEYTKIIEGDGKEWTSRIPGVTFFIPNEWFNIVALLVDEGVRYYCNIASPPEISEHLVTYIDYDLDVTVSPSGFVQVVDQDEYELHRMQYTYTPDVEEHVMRGLDSLLERIKEHAPPFGEEQVMTYYQMWKESMPDRQR
ncbi:DUF402 domain-containing protein [Paenibacillus sp. KN14-4R]|uniref:DUF402 domain-containing protein n=1 Tax=Paenibacillus sp. KN14-4R TaxID=3445773 RepID=UPI003F9FA363